MLCLGAAARAPMQVPALLLAAVAIGWAGWLYEEMDPRAFDRGFEEEEVREFGGLVLVAVTALAILGTGRGAAPSRRL